MKFIFSFFPSVVLFAGIISIGTTAYSMSLENLLLQAIEESDQQAFDEALRMGADPLYRNEYGLTPLQKTISLDNYAMFRTLLQHTSSDGTSTEGLTDALSYAVGRLPEDPRFLNSLMDRGADPFAALPSLCQAAVHDRVLEILSRPDVDQDRIDRYDLPLKIVVAAYLYPRSYDQAISLLNQLKKMDVELNRPNPRGETAVLKALEFELPDLLEILDEDGRYADRLPEMTPPSLVRRLFDAVEHNDVAAAENLLLQNADPNGVHMGLANQGTPILGMAAAKGHLGMIKLLQAHGGQLNPQARSSIPLTQYALRKAYTASEAAYRARGEKRQKWLDERARSLVVLDYLLSEGLDIDSRSKFGFTALHKAAAHIDPFVLGLLLRKGANPDAQSVKGVNPLMVALDKSNLEAAKELMRYGADPYLADENGESAVDKAYELKEVALLRQMDTKGTYRRFIHEYTPDPDSPLIGTWSNGESGFSTVIIHLESTGHGAMVNAIGIAFRFIWKQLSADGKIKMTFPPQRHLDVVITGSGPQEEKSMAGRLDMDRDRLILDTEKKEEGIIFERASDSELMKRSSEQEKGPSKDERLDSAFEQAERNSSFYYTDPELEGWPERIFDQTALRRLNIPGSHLKSIPDGIGGLVNLLSIDVHSNDIAWISPTISRLSRLTELNLANNRLESLPPELSHLNLKRLDLSNNLLTGFPEELRFSPELENLDLSNNRLVETGNAFSLGRSLKTLNLQENELTHLGGNLGGLANLNSLNLSFNRFRNLPESLAELSSLTWLNLSNNKLRTIPKSLGHLPKLKNLDLSYNFISSLPADLDSLKSLTWLDLSYNRLESLPSQLADLPALQEININGNPIPKEEIEAFKKKAPNVRFRVW